MKVLAISLSGAKKEIEQDLGVEVNYNGDKFIVYVDDYGRLCISTVGLRSIIVVGRSANCLEIRSEK